MSEQAIYDYLCAAIDTLEQIPDWRSNQLYVKWWESLNELADSVQDNDGGDQE